MTQELYGPRVMTGLKSFQRDTVEYAFQRLYLDAKPTHRFLVADEVGLGKTLVARGVIAKAIDHLRRQKVKRIDVVYICSNADIAQQNIRKLNVTGQPALERATRLTKLASDLHQLKTGDVNLVSLTPGTSFSLGESAGQKEERALLYWLLRHAWDARALRHPGVFRLLRGGANDRYWPGYVKTFRPQRIGSGPDTIDRDVAKLFAENLTTRDEETRAVGGRPLQDRFLEVADHLRTRERPEWRRQANQLVGELRRILARSSVDALEPDLIILDEFQRYRQLLDTSAEGDDTRALAQQLFNYESSDGHARTLLLSATPYKMYTLSDETDHDDHYGDFVKTTEFLLGEETGTFRDELRAYREAILQLGEIPVETLRKRRRAVEARLRRVMSRTERLAATEDRSGMLQALPPSRGEVSLRDAKAFVAFDRISRHVGSTDTVEYWKSAPYPLSFMDGYEVKRKIRAAVADPAVGKELAGLLKGAEGLLDPVDLAAYAALDPGNGRLRAIAGDMVESGAWRLLWVPASMPYYEPRGVFRPRAVRGLTKRLVFSSWQVVPQAVANVLSYQVERRMMHERDRDAVNTAEARAKISSPLRLARVAGRAGSMSTFGFIFPSVWLASQTDPLEIAASLASKSPTVSADALLRRATERLGRWLRPLLREAPSDGPVDEDWYWAAPILLEREAQPDALNAFFGRKDRELLGVWAAAEGEMAEDVDGLALHLARAREAVSGRLRLGRPPSDLVETLALAGVAGPANAALRALSRGSSHASDVADVRIRDAAARVAWGFRSLFGTPEVMALVRGRSGTEKAYWRRALGYCLDGNLQAVLDEYCHVLPEWLGLLQQEPGERARTVANGIHEALTVRAPLYGYDAFRVENGSVAIDSERLRARFALRFGVNSSDEGDRVQRSSAIRTAFNSPFWPFVLVTTSVGQEGLDFHQYCHAIVHWNLPANPVDFEQREGRVHRYKGHAVRRNVAQRHRRDVVRANVTDPWQAAFDAAARSPQARRQHDLVPFWIYEGPHKIERHVPVLPMSREIDQLERLKKSLAVYRMVFGQPRQEDLAAWLESRLSPKEFARYRDALTIHLRPRRYSLTRSPSWSRVPPPHPTSRHPLSTGGASSG